MDIPLDALGNLLRAQNGFILAIYRRCHAWSPFVVLSGSRGNAAALVVLFQLINHRLRGLHFKIGAIMCTKRSAIERPRLHRPETTPEGPMPKVALTGRFASLCFVVISLILSTLSPVQAFARDLTIALPANVNTLDPHNSTTVATDLSVKIGRAHV